jgi:hypothetical protein
MSVIKNHPLETVFGMDSGTMSFGIDDTQQEVIPFVQPTSIIDDEEDIGITADITEIYKQAMAAFSNQTELAEIVEPRFAARNAEVANQYLNTALNSVALKAKIKNEKRKNQPFTPSAINTTNNIISCDRNALLDMIRNKDKS